MHLPSNSGGGLARGSNSLDFGWGGRVGAAFITGVLTLYLKAPTLSQSRKDVSSPRADPVNVSFWIYNLSCTGELSWPAPENPSAKHCVGSVWGLSVE